MSDISSDADDNASDVELSSDSGGGSSLQWIDRILLLQAVANRQAVSTLGVADAAPVQKAASPAAKTPTAQRVAARKVVEDSSSDSDSEPNSDSDADEADDMAADPDASEDEGMDEAARKAANVKALLNNRYRCCILEFVQQTGEPCDMPLD